MSVHLLKITKSLDKLALTSNCNIPRTLLKNSESGLLFTNSSRPTTNFFNKLPAEALWKGITSVSNAGKKRGRGKTVSKKNIKDLNRGQIIGVGKVNMLWPGLSGPILRGKELVTQQQLPEDPEREKKLIALRDKMGFYRYPKTSPIDRGWSGAKMPGRSIGAPDRVGEDRFDGFDSKVLELKTVFNMKGNFGRKRRQTSIVVTGNANGLAGFSIGKGADSKTALKKAKNRAAQRLMHINIFRGHTVYHDFFSAFGATKIYVSQRPEGHGLICHRAIATICNVLGIKDLYAKVEGSTNVNHITKAFFLGLLKQKTHEQIAEEKKLHLVEFCKENGFFPNVLASPTKCRTDKEVDSTEILDFTQYCLDGKVRLKKKKFPPFYTRLRSWEIYLKKQAVIRNQDKVKLNMIAQYGEIRSFLTEKYPECKPYKAPPKQKEVEEQEEEEQ